MHQLVANCAPLDRRGACRIVANDGPRADVRAAVELNPETDDDHSRGARLSLRRGPQVTARVVPSVARPRLLFILDKPRRALGLRRGHALPAVSRLARQACFLVADHDPFPWPQSSNRPLSGNQSPGRSVEHVRSLRAAVRWRGFRGGFERRTIRPSERRPSTVPKAWKVSEVPA